MLQPGCLGLIFSKHYAKATFRATSARRVHTSVVAKISESGAIKVAVHPLGYLRSFAELLIGAWRRAI